MAGLGSWIDRWADFQPDKTAIVYAGREISYAGLAREIRRFSLLLVRKLGISRGDRVGFLGYNHPHLLSLLFACARVGGILVPFNWRLAAAEHAYILRNAEISVLFATAEFRERADSLREASSSCRVLVLDDAADPSSSEAYSDGAEGVLNPDVTYEDPVLLVYTSGTTGRPKGAILSQAAVFWNAVNSTHAHDLDSTDRILTVAPLFHVGGLNIQTVPALHAGASVVLHPRFDPAQALQAINGDGPTMMILVPAIAKAMIEHSAWAETDLSSLRHVSLGSQVVPEPIVRAFHDRGVPVVQIYGATETAPIAIYLRAEDCERFPSAGKPAIHCEAMAVDAAGREVPAGERGEILVRGANVFLGYWRDEESTRAALKDGWFRTGDIGYRDARGYWFITDRSKDVIISGGENIYPAELEAVLDSCDAVQECAVIGRADAHWGQVPVAFVVLKPGRALSAPDALGLFQARLARFKHPRDVIFVDALPRNTMGKVLKNHLRERVMAAAS